MLNELILGLNPVSYWKLGEASGDAVDTGGAGFDGTVTLGAGARASTPIDDEGDGSLTFDGAATFVSVPHQATLEADAFSIVALINCTAFSAAAIFSKGRADLTQYYQCSITAAGRLVFDISTSVTGFSRNTINAGAWLVATEYLLAATYTSGAQTLSLTNLATGAVISGSAAAPTGTMVVNDTAFTIGAETQAAVQSFFNGVIDEPAYFNFALSTAQIAALATRAHAIWTRTTRHRREGRLLNGVTDE